MQPDRRSPTRRRLSRSPSESLTPSLLLLLSVSVGRCTPLQRMTAVHREANLVPTVTPKRSLLEWSPLNSVAFLFFLPSRRDGRTLCFHSSFGDFLVRFNQGWSNTSSWQKGRGQLTRKHSSRLEKSDDPVWDCHWHCSTLVGGSE